ncbi:unnamed protein product [Urochloa humidicola]
MASLGSEIFSRGFRFNPSALEAATYYLPRLVAGAPLHDAVHPIVHRANVYACEPGDLARRFPPLPKTGHRFFFTSCKLQQPTRAGKASRAARAAGAGAWHSQGVTGVVDLDGIKVGETTKLRYKKGGVYTDWLMDDQEAGAAARSRAAVPQAHAGCRRRTDPSVQAAGRLLQGALRATAASRHRFISSDSAASPDPFCNAATAAASSHPSCSAAEPLAGTRTTAAS